MKKFVIYTRVSTARQGESGLGLESQLNSCTEYVRRMDGEIIAHMRDVESGKSRTRVGLLKAIDMCKEEGATLVIAKLDRLARDVEFVFRVYNTGIEIYICDMPVINSMVLGVFAAVGQYERELISRRTKDGLKVTKDRGQKLGSLNEKWRKHENNVGVIQRWQHSGSMAASARACSDVNSIRAASYIRDAREVSKESWTKIAEDLNKYGFKTPRGCEFHPKTVQRMYENRDRYES